MAEFPLKPAGYPEKPDAAALCAVTRLLVSTAYLNRVHPNPPPPPTADQCDLIAAHLTAVAGFLRARQPKPLVRKRKVDHRLKR